MITPKEIETKQFTSTKGGGYKGDEVDQFLDEILVDYTRLLEERNSLKNKVNLLTEKLNSIASAPAPAPAPAPEPAPAPVPVVTPVVINHTPSDEMEAARKKAQRLVSDAEDYAKKLIETAQYEANRQNAVTKKMTAEIEAFKNSLLDTYSAHIKMVESIPNMDFDAIKIGSETLDILNQSLNDAPAADAVAEPVQSAPVVVEEAFEIPTRAEEPVVPEGALAFDPEAFEVPTKRGGKDASKGLEDLFDEGELKNKKKEKKKKKKLFFRDEDDDDDDDFFDDDDE